MAKKRGTKQIVWCNWSVNIAGRTFSGRGQFNAKAFRDYTSTNVDKREIALGHIASVIKGELKKRGDIPRNSTPHLERQHIKIWDPSVGPKEISRGRSTPKEPAQTSFDFD